MNTRVGDAEVSGAVGPAAPPSARNESDHPLGIGRGELLAAIGGREGTAPELREVVFRGRRVAFAGRKSAASADLAEAFVSMANTNGGLVVLGVRERDRAVVGIPPERRRAVERFVVSVATAQCDPTILPGLYWRHLPDDAGAERLCLALRILPSFREFHCTADGRYLRRSEGRVFLMPAHLLEPVLKRQRRPRPPIEDRPVRGSRPSDLDRTLLDAYFLRRFPERPPPEDRERQLRNHRFAVETDDGTIPTVFGLLMFCRRPDEHWPGAFLEIRSYAGDERGGEPPARRRVSGPLPQQVAEAVSILEESSQRPADSGDGEVPAYSIPALQEAVVNAVIHRDYAIPSPVVIRRFPSRIEIENPGSLFRTLSPEHLYAGAPPQRRNQMLAGILYHYDSRVTGRPLARSGREPGFLPLVSECERLSGRRPEVDERGYRTRLTIHAAAATGAGTARERTGVPKE